MFTPPKIGCAEKIKNIATIDDKMNNNLKDLVQKCTLFDYFALKTLHFCKLKNHCAPLITAINNDSRDNFVGHLSL